MGYKLEICCGSYEDVCAAQRGGADRAELNSALHMGGLTPSLASLIMAKRDCQIPIVAMVRGRGAGFCYNETEKKVMLEDAALLLEHGADGLAFGYLKEDATIDEEAVRIMCDLIHSYGKCAVFHRAFDCVIDMDGAMEKLISLGVDRVLTSGGQPNVEKGSEMLAHLQETYGSQMEILAGCGVNEMNAKDLIEITKVQQLHSSCKVWKNDPTTIGKQVSYAYAAAPHEMAYDVVSEERVRALRKAMM